MKNGIGDSNTKISGIGKLSTTHLSGNKTIYKYLFDCTEISYRELTGKVSSMRFRLQENTESNYPEEKDKESFWKKEWN